MIGVLIALWWGFMLTHPWLSVPMALGILTVIGVYAYLRLTDENEPQHKASRPVSRSRAGKARAARRTRSPRDQRRAPGAITPGRDGRVDQQDWTPAHEQATGQPRERRTRLRHGFATRPGHTITRLIHRRQLSPYDEETLNVIGWMRDHDTGGLIAANSGAPVHAPDAPGPAGLPSGERAPDGLTAVAVPAAGPGAHPDDDDKEYPEWLEKLSIACARGDCGDCTWPLCSCVCHADETEPRKFPLEQAVPAAGPGAHLPAPIPHDGPWDGHADMPVHHEEYGAPLQWFHPEPPEAPWGTVPPVAALVAAVRGLPAGEYLRQLENVSAYRDERTFHDWERDSLVLRVLTDDDIARMDAERAAASVPEIGDYGDGPGVAAPREWHAEPEEA